MRGGALALAIVLLSPAQAAAEWQIKPFVGLTFGGGTTLLDPEFAAGSANLVVGVSGMLLGELIGVEGDVARAPGFFQSGDTDLIRPSSVTTFTGNIVLALPRRLTEYTLRPYVVGGAGVIRARSQSPEGVNAVQVASNLAALDLGGGVTGFLRPRIGLNWDVRYFRGVNGSERQSVIAGEPERLSFWRAHMALAIRY